MRIILNFRGQLANALGGSSEKIDVDCGSSINSILQDLALRGGTAFTDIAFDSHGTPSRTLLVAVDGEQVTDFGMALASHTKEITFIPPIAGG
ncbi:MAG: MoaD/ThiS family protein [Verrucomicrobiales bacterium]|jgi:molybdopterin converting factor small subunit